MLAPDRTHQQHAGRARHAAPQPRPVNPVAQRMLDVQRLAGNKAATMLAAGTRVQRDACCAGCAGGGECESG